MKKVITFGEVMLRFNPAGFGRILQSASFEANLAGSESNVAVSLANYGVSVSYVTKVPIHEVGQIVVNEMKRYGVDTSHIYRGGKRLGIFYLEKGASQRPSKVIYDRAGSSFAESLKEEYDWDEIFDGACWFHFSGITPALSDELAEACLIACKKAKEKGITVSCDTNYRKQLWTKEKAGKVMSELMTYVDLAINPDVFGIDLNYKDDGSMPKREEYIDVAKKLSERFGCKRITLSIRESFSADRNIYSAMIYNAETGAAEFSKEYDIHIVDRVGSGDSFVGALIYSLIKGKCDKEALEFATAAACLKHSIEYDFNLVSESEVIALMNGNSTGRISR